MYEKFYRRRGYYKDRAPMEILSKGEIDGRRSYSQERLLEEESILRRDCWKKDYPM